MTAEETQRQRDDRVLAYITRKGQPTRAEILYDLATLCGGERGLNTTIARLLRRGAITLTPNARESPAIGRRVGVYSSVAT